MEFFVVENTTTNKISFWILISRYFLLVIGWHKVLRSLRKFIEDSSLN